MTDKITDQLYILAGAFEGREIGADLFRKIIDLKQTEAILEAIETMEILYGELKRLNHTASSLLEKHKYQIGNDYGILKQAIYEANLVLNKYKLGDER
jgi:hypothetical protein